MSILDSHNYLFKLDATLISYGLFIDFQAKTDTITQWIRHSHDYPAPFHYSNTLLPHQKKRLAFLWDQEVPNGQSSHNIWATLPPGSTFNVRNIITNRVISSFKLISTNTPLGELLADDMGIGRIIQAIALIGTSKERLITNPHRSTPTLLNPQLAIRNIQACSGWSTASQQLPRPHLSLII
ncbi:hypothetical protein O181_063514 [Austropuccinia psidii MF-1]|uniref:Uncharacterized protein n=1 Tax=Austropuccinia psidii MF-1 TaxID=1389203 RepID=A0A9Q3EMA5_9BASI|nr:hypothetical protein [Austropuccinia psidii MF-1]